MATDEEIINTIRDMTAPGYPLGLHTLKASVLTKDRKRVKEIINGMVRHGELKETKKNRYTKKEH